jgi:hypothetical protein
MGTKKELRMAGGGGEGEARLHLAAGLARRNAAIRKNQLIADPHAVSICFHYAPATCYTAATFSLCRCPTMPEPKPRSVPLPLSGPAPVLDESVWYAQGLRFACTQCGNCCSGFPGYVWLTVEDMQRIADYLKIPLDTFTRTYVRRVGSRYSLTEKYNYDCTFLTRANGKSGCMIYPVRPMQCRTWPFWDDNLKSPAHWKHASERGGGCPGMCDAEAPHYPLAHIEKCHQHPESPR